MEKVFKSNWMDFTFVRKGFVWTQKPTSNSFENFEHKKLRPLHFLGYGGGVKAVICGVVCGYGSARVAGGERILRLKLTASPVLARLLLNLFHTINTII